MTNCWTLIPWTMCAYEKGWFSVLVSSKFSTLGHHRSGTRKHAHTWIRSKGIKQNLPRSWLDLLVVDSFLKSCCFSCGSAYQPRGLGPHLCCDMRLPFVLWQFFYISWKALTDVGFYCPKIESKIKFLTFFSKFLLNIHIWNSLSSCQCVHFKDWFIFILCVCACSWVHVFAHMCRHLWRPEESFGSLELGVVGSCEMPHVDADEQNQVLCKSSKQARLISEPSLQPQCIHLHFWFWVDAIWLCCRSHQIYD